MAEIGLVQFAGLCRNVCEATVPAYRTKFSKHVFTQPQLLSILCLMRYEDWTFREAEVRLAEHRELRKAIGLKEVPDYTTLYRFFRRLDERHIIGIMQETIKRLKISSPDTGIVLAVDGTGLERGSVSTFFRQVVKGQGTDQPWRQWLKWVIAADVTHGVVLAQRAHPGPWNDSATLRPLVSEANSRSRIRAVVADAEFDSEKNHRFIRYGVHALSAIPAKRGHKSWQPRGFRSKMRLRFPRKLYSLRALVESLFSSIKRKLSAKAPGRSWFTQRKQAFLLGTAFDLYKLRHVFRSQLLTA